MQAASSGIAPNRWPGLLAILGCALAVALPLAVRGNSCGHDFDFHIQSWLAVAQQWRQGVFYPHWVEGANYAAGEPRLVFYPPFSWMLGALLGSVMPWAAAPVAFTFLIMAGCGLSMQRLAREWISPQAATLAACAYMLNPYALFVAYERTAYGELAAGIWLPLIILFGLRGLFGLRRRNSLIPLALSIAAIWLTNAPAAVMSCYLLAMIAIWISITRRQWQPILQSAVGLLLGLGLSAFYLAPAAYERRWVDIARAIGEEMRIEDSFLFAHTGGAFHDQVLRTASWIVLLMLATIAASMWFAWKQGVSRRILLPLAATSLMVFVLQLRWSSLLWNHLPELKFLQFPWRWCLVLSIVLAISFGAPFSQHKRSRFGVTAVVLLVIIAIAMVATGTRLFWQPCDEDDVVSAQLQTFHDGTGFEGTDEYTTLGADNSQIPDGLPQAIVLDDQQAEIANDGVPNNPAAGTPNYVPGAKDEIPAKLEIQQWKPERRAFFLTTQVPGFAVLRLMDYPAWQIRVNDLPASPRSRRDDGLTVVPVAAGRNRIDVVYIATRDVLYGRALSGASLLSLVAIYALDRRRRRVGYHGGNAS
jgi:hypothetical protein